MHALHQAFRNPPILTARPPRSNRKHTYGQSFCFFWAQTNNARKEIDLVPLQRQDFSAPRSRVVARRQALVRALFVSPPTVSMTTSTGGTTCSNLVVL